MPDTGTQGPQPTPSAKTHRPPCERSLCRNIPPADLRYCSTACFDADNDPIAIQPIARNKVDGFGIGVSRGFRQPVRL